MSKHAVYANCRDLSGDRATFRIGAPLAWGAAQDRWLRLDDARRAKREQVVNANRRRYLVESYEVRSVDRHGRGLGSDRHASAIPVAYRSLSR